MTKNLTLLVYLIFIGLTSSGKNPDFLTDSIPGIKKIKDIIIYQDPLFYAAFPSVIKKKNGELLIAFRRAPERKTFGEKNTKHVDPNSYLVALSSKDGENWTKEPSLIYAHSLGGSQDPCMLQLKDGTILCASYGWSFLRSDGLANLKKTHLANEGATFLGGYLIRSTDQGKTWQGPIYPPAIDPEVNHDMYGNKVPAYNRGALYEGKNGTIYWVAAATDNLKRKTSNHLLVSEDKGLTWKYSSVVATDEKISFNETSIYETPKGDLVAFLRTGNFEDEACISRSTDGGKTFKWEGMGFKGHPLHALRLPDNRVLVTYGYRHQPFGIRARILNAECTDFKTASEVILRTDGGGGDIGYPWAVQLNKKQVLVSYYYNIKDGPRHIAATILEIDPKK